MLVDGHSLAFRSYYAFAKSKTGGLRTKTGIPTSVCFGFIKSLLEVIASEQPQAMAIAFDTDTPTFRHEADTNYKANRAETPEDFILDLANLPELLVALDLPVITSPGYEADDVLATLAYRASDEGYRVKILTGDRDLFQLVDDQKQIKVLYLHKDFLRRGNATGTLEFGPEEVKEKLGVTPPQVVDYKALCGDKSDNIPGVKGIGEKTAVQLLKEYGSLEEIYASLAKIKGANQKKLAVGKPDAEHSQYLAQLKFDAPVEIALNDAKLQGFDIQILTPILQKLEFQSFLDKIDQLQQQFGGKITTDTPIESSETANIPSEDTENEDTWFFTPADTDVYQQQLTPPSQIQPQIIDTPDKLIQLVNQLKTYTNPTTPVAWDTETTDLEPRDAELVGIGCCWGSQPTDIAYIPISHTKGNNLDKNTALAGLRPILENANYPKALQNAKFDRLVLRTQNIHLTGVVFDTMLASYVINPDLTHNLNDLCERYLSGIKSKSYKELNIPKGKTIADLNIPTVADYCGMDAYATFSLVAKLQAELAQIPILQKLLLEVEQPLEPVLAEMENLGISIDSAYLKQLSNLLEKDLAKIEESAYQVAGDKFNLGSPKQLSELLFEKLQLDRKKSRKIKTGYSTDHATLEKLQGDHPIIDALLEHRTLSKLKSTYVDALPLLVRPDTQRIHTDFNQTATSTGRLSSSNPNLQNIPIRTAFSRQIRKAFLPETGWLLVSADYSQIELRILAHLSQEPVLVETYQKNEDIHTVTARLLFEKSEITPDERRLGKTINFGVIYGMGAQRFAREAGVSSAEGKIFIDRLKQRYPLVFAYLEQMKRNAIAKGYVETILGRRRYFEFNSNTLRKYKDSNPNDIKLDKIKDLDQYDAGLLRAAANAPIQGSSADIIKIAMIKIHELLQNYQSRLLLQVHDELIFEIPPEEWSELQLKIKQTMESAVTLTVPLVVDINAGENWMEAK
ncbi:DNA polymerase I [Symplocastrum sp. BBK-W-15]|uniref:DNA polymerase I n=1 Tax=Limnofasciculus baicalensis BBK-W-15 TaxID=2699891 RepID=A0AAE3GW99_9CYAN|nr:DNA polymerase I [Limnofasciculus baicalensis]MCP2731885.1 DNA polymerase I [Limnofasciculus baicalensis BBK-W-15]